MGQFCKDDIPLLCDHSLLRNSSRHTRPCSHSESYVSSGRDLTLEHILRQGSALYPISFVLRYEFVHDSMSCHLVFSPTSITPSSPSASVSSASSKASGTSGKFSSPKSVFFYGRGGAQNLSCVYRFEAEIDQRIELTIARASFGEKGCTSYIDPLIDRWACEGPTPEELKKNGKAELVVSEHPWTGVELVRDCLCSNVTERIVLKSLTSNVVEIKFIVSRMNVTQDYDNYFFEGEYRFVPSNEFREDQSCPTKLEERKLRGTSGEISLRSPLPRNIAGIAAVEEILPNTEDLTTAQCVNEPWLIEPEDVRMNFLYLRTSGFAINADNIEDCTTLNRIIVYSAANTKDRSVICPEGANDLPRTVDFFSGGWNYSLINSTPPVNAIMQHSRSFVVEFLQREPGFYALTWMAISKRATATSLGSNTFALDPTEDCPYR